MENPYRALIKKTGEPLTSDYKLPGQTYPMMDRNGEINASSRKDVLQQINAILKAHSDGDIIRNTQSNPEIITSRKQALIEAVNDSSNQKMQILGQALASEIIDTTTREGFARRILQYNEIGQGENNQVRLRQHDVTAYMAVSTTEVQPVIVRGRMVNPPEFNNEAFILVDLKELATTPGDLLEEKYEEGLEAVMVSEDRLWKRLADQSCVLRNNIQYFTTFTPQVFSRIRSQVARWGIPTPTCLISQDIWDDIIGNADFAGVFSEVTKYELIQEGYLGQMYNVQFITDAHRQDKLRVLNAGEVFVVGAPINHGVITVRGAMLMEPINKYSEGRSMKGWFMNQILSMVLGNPASTGKGQRI